MPLQLASHCMWVGCDELAVRLKLEESAEHLMTERFSQRLQTGLSDWFGKPMKLHIEIVDAVLDTPSRIAEQQAADDLAAAHHSIKLDPIVRQLIDQVDGAVDESSIKPIDGSTGSA